MGHEGVLAIATVMQEWPFPASFVLKGVLLSMCWEALRLPREARSWPNERIQAVFRERHDQVICWLGCRKCWKCDNFFRFRPDDLPADFAGFSAQAILRNASGGDKRRGDVTTSVR